jgi:hypothetical protein
VRQAFLVIMLVAASFLGGAFVNGPGLNWAQTRLLRSLGLSEGAEIASVDLKATPSADPNSDGSRPAKPGTETMQGPTAPVPSLIAENESSKNNASDRRSEHRSNSSADGLARSKPASSTSPGPKPASSTATAPTLLASSREPTPSQPDDLAPNPSRSRALPDPSVPPDVAAPAAAPSPGRLDPSVAPALLDSLAALLPSAAPSSGSPSPAPGQSSREPKSAAQGGHDWTILRSKMQTLGVSRFTIEGEPGGRVVFSCLIPLAGRAAVAQRFEAEGDDVFQAAQAALRRVALWRATQPPLP